jgi:hypothetical protein
MNKREKFRRKQAALFDAVGFNAKKNFIPSIC